MQTQIILSFPLFLQLASHWRIEFPGAASAEASRQPRQPIRCALPRSEIEESEVNEDGSAGVKLVCRLRYEITQGSRIVDDRLQMILVIAVRHSSSRSGAEIASASSTWKTRKR